MSRSFNNHWSNRIRQLETSERGLLLQPGCALHLSMQHSQRLDQRLNMLREEVRTMTQEKDRGEWVWRNRLQRCQRQLKAKEEEMRRQTQYFESIKSQLQLKLSLARNREQSLQSRIHVLEKQVLHMTVSAATGMAMTSAVRITASTGRHQEEQERLPPMRGEGEGEEEREEEKRRQWQPSVGTKREGDQEGNEGKTEKELQQQKMKSNEARLQDFILSLQEDLRVLLEREEDGMTERKALMEQLQEAQEKSQSLCCKVEDKKAEVHQLKMSESSLMEEVRDLREENHRLKQILRDTANQAPSQSLSSGPGTGSPSCSPVVSPRSSNSLPYNTSMGSSSVGNSGEAAAESTQNKKEDRSATAKSVTNLSLQSLSLTTETLDEFEPGTWCSRGILNLEECPSEESDALREAYRSLRLGTDAEALKEQCDNLKITLQHTQEQLKMVAQENTQLKLQIRTEAEEKRAEADQGPTREKISTSDRAEDNNILALTQDDLIQALNQENRALADRIQELLDHIAIREEQIKGQETLLRQQMSEFELDRARLEQENQEHGCLITELTKKTEDDLNTIMELQQKLVESETHMEQSQAGKERRGSQMQSGDTATIPGRLQQDNLEECVDRFVDSILKEEEHLMSIQEPDCSTAALLPGPPDQNNLLLNSLQSSLHVRSLTYEEGQLTKLVQSLKVEQKELLGGINGLRAQQTEVARSVQTQTEVKQQLTRMVWGLKEERDIVTQSLASLKQDREQLTKAVCSMKEERDQFIKSISGLKEEKDQLTKSLSVIEREKETLLESLSRVKEERDLIVHSMQSSQMERDQLSQALLLLKEEKIKLTNSLECLKGSRLDQQSSHTSQGDCDRWMKSVINLRDEKERIELLTSCLKQEEEQRKLLLHGVREERNGPKATLSRHTQTEGGIQHPMNANRAKTCEILLWTGQNSTQRCDRGNSLQLAFDGMQEKGDLMREFDTLGVELKKSRDELDKSRDDTRRLQRELCYSETRREEAETTAAQMAEKVSRLTDAASQVEETRKENEVLVNQVKELQSRLTALAREKTDAQALKAQIEKQYNILNAQLKAKTVALEELNSEYITLKQGQGSKDDQSTLLVSLRTRYNSMRSKYDALLKKKSPSDLEMAPLKAKLSCLVVKCQERNRLLVQMLEAMHRQGCQDLMLTQQVALLLNDAALQDYASAFTPGNKTWDYSSGFTSSFISKFQCHATGVTPDQNGSEPDSQGKCRKLKSGGNVSSVTSESTANHQSYSSEATASPTGTLKKNANSPVPFSPAQDHTSVQVMPSAFVPALTEDLMTNTAQLSPSPSAHLNPTRRLSSPEKIMNLHEQLQKTLMSIYQAPANRGRSQQPGRDFSFSSPVDLGQASPTKEQNLSLRTHHANSVPVATALSPAKRAPAVEATPVSTKSMTLFNAVASRSANATCSPSGFTSHHIKTDSKNTTSALSNSSKFPSATVAPSKAKLIFGSGANITISPKLTKKITEAAHGKGLASIPKTLRATTLDPDIVKLSETNLRTTPLRTLARIISSDLDSNDSSKTDGADAACDGFAFAASCTPEKSCKSARKCTAAVEKTTRARPRPEAPAEVRAVEVIKTVGQSSLMIGWERPPLDELGCSNGTFVYGYRVMVNGDFHKSVMSSACTKCILENVDLTVPADIGVQTLGSNGLCSNSVRTMWTR